MRDISAATGGALLRITLIEPVHLADVSDPISGNDLTRPGALSSSSVSMPADPGAVIEVAFNEVGVDVPDFICAEFDLAGQITGLTGADTDFRVRFIRGDTNESGDSVTFADLANTNAARIVGGASTPTGAGNFKKDPNVSGSITFADLAAVNASRLALMNGAIQFTCP